MKYTVTLSNGEKFTMIFDAAEASAPILWVDDYDEVRQTVYQTADACHSPFEGAECILRWWATGAEYQGITVDTVEFKEIPTDCDACGGSLDTCFCNEY